MTARKQTAELSPTSVGVAEHTDTRERFGLIHRPTQRREPGTTRRHPHRVHCGTPLKAALPVEYAGINTTPDEWCGDCWDTSNRVVHTVTLRRGPFSHVSKRATPVCDQCGDLTSTHVDYGTARDIGDEHVRVESGVTR